MKQKYSTELLKEMLESQASTAVSNYFADNAMLAYEDEEPVAVLNNRATQAYSACKEEMQQFMSKILLADMLVNNLSSAECRLILPYGELSIKVGATVNAEALANTAEPKTVTTKLGVFDEFTWQMLCDIKKEHNPVKICFGHIEEYLHFMLCKLDWRETDLIKGTITEDLLDEYHIQESVPIHSLVNLYLGIGSFCNDGKEL